METSEKIVEAYVRYIKGWATIPNVKCPGQYEIDLIAIDPVTLNRYHIESSVSVSPPFSKLTNLPFSDEKLKERVQKPKQRRTLGYFIERKFSPKEVIDTLNKYGFEDKKYKKIIVTWDFENEAQLEANKAGIEIWNFRDLISEIAEHIKDERAHFNDDTMRTLQLFTRAK